MKYGCFLSLIFLAGCYKVPDGQVPHVAPSYTILVNGYDTIGTDTFNYLAVWVNNTSTNYDTRLSFRALSGDVANYPLTCYLQGLPTSVTCTPDSDTFKLNYDVAFHLAATSLKDTGKYQINIMVAEAGVTKAYPITLHVYPN